MDITVFAHPDAEHRPRIEAAVGVVNHVQQYFRLAMEPATWLPNGDGPVHGRGIAEQARRRHPNGASVVVVNNPLKGGWFSSEHREVTVISVNDWEAEYVPPSLKVYLVYMFVGALLNAAADIAEETNLYHEPIGCFFDQIEHGGLIKLGMVGGNLCGPCEMTLMGLGLPQPALRAVEQVLGYVRDATIRRARELPQSVFIGHGRSGAWEALSGFLIGELGLTVEEFNRDPVAGVATTERLMQMLDRSVMAFIVMTAEDEHGGGEGTGGAATKLHARQNVVHEAGLFQGRLGFRRTIILLERGCASFSNIDGMTYISFPKGRILDARQKIAEVLQREGLIDDAAVDRAVAPKKKRKP